MMDVGAPPVSTRPAWEENEDVIFTLSPSFPFLPPYLFLVPPNSSTVGSAQTQVPGFSPCMMGILQLG